MTEVISDEEEKDYGASFFFVSGVEDLDSTRLVFPTLAYQLAQSLDVLRPHIVNAAHEHRKRLGGKTQQMKHEATRSTSVLRRHVASYLRCSSCSSRASAKPCFLSASSSPRGRTL